MGVIKKYSTWLFSLLSKPLPGITTSPEEGIDYWRNKIYYYLSFALFYISIPIVIVSVAASIIGGIWLIAVLNILVYLTCTIVILYKRLSIKVKSVILSLIFYFIGFYVELYIGPYGAGLIWLFAFSVIGGILIGAQFAYITLIINTLTCLFFSIGLKLNLFENFIFGVYNQISWITVSINFLALDLAAIVALAIILKGLQSHIIHEVQLKLHYKEKKEKAEFSDFQKSNFLAEMSHEIRNPMNSILGFSDLLRQNNLTPEKKELYHTIIHEKGLHLINLINDIIDISKIEANKIVLTEEPSNIKNMLEELITSFQEELRVKKIQNISLQLYHSSEDPGNVNIDPFRFKQILINLVSNAIKYTKEGRIEVGYEYNRDGAIKFYVKDTGIGIEPQLLLSIFDRYEQAANNYIKKGEGAGLGLYITKNLIDLMNGKIWVESTLEKGSCFYFQIPYHPATLEN